MKLGLSIGYASSTVNLPVEAILCAERLGYDSVWTAEAYGADAVTPLAYLAAVTRRIRLGTGIMQMSARTPAATAMAMATLDQLAGGDRVIIGLGLSGPQVVEGWHGRPWGNPIKRTREYVEILRKILAREDVVSYQGVEYQIPYNGVGASGLGKPLKSILHTRRLPIYLATLGPSNVKNTAELADGWLPMWFSPNRMNLYRPWLEEGFDRTGTGKKFEKFEIQPTCTVMVDQDVKECFRKMKPRIALYMGGMGTRGHNFHNDVLVRYGYGDVAARIQDLYLAGQRDEAADVVPDDLCDEIALVGPPERIRERYRFWEDSGITGLTIQTQDLSTIDLMARISGSLDEN